MLAPSMYNITTYVLLCTGKKDNPTYKNYFNGCNYSTGTLVPGTSTGVCVRPSAMITDTHFFLFSFSKKFDDVSELPVLYQLCFFVYLVLTRALPTTGYCDDNVAMNTSIQACQMVLDHGLQSLNRGPDGNRQTAHFIAGNH